MIFLKSLLPIFEIVTLPYLSPEEFSLGDKPACATSDFGVISFIVVLQTF